MSPRRHAPLVLLVSFEGPDAYAMAGGLGQRVSTLAASLAREGYETHLFFVGDPNLPGEETREDGRLVLHRWAQWVSRFYPGGTYAGEEDKWREVSHSLPPRLAALAEEAARQNRPCRILFEDWQCAEAARRTADALWHVRLSHRGLVAIAHNTNTLMQVERADLASLRDRVTLMTVSRFMKHALWAHAVNPVVVPNGVPEAAFEPPDPAAVAAVAALKAAGRTVLVKVARFDPDKAWLAAVEGVARLRGQGLEPLLLMRGGVEAHGHDVLRRVDELGLRIRDGHDGTHVPTPEEARTVDIWHYRARIPDAVLRALYHAAHATLAQSGIEPFGLVGLEVMAQGGVVLTGATGEDYARHGRNALVVETGTPAEIAHLAASVARSPALARRLGQGGRDTAKTYTWRHIIPELLDRMSLGEGI
jgi:glycosyltransferase involved in cell wall biosynthesis